tara:strand:- start:305 stop:838 length:534 start_codon:yes stop_codon:yes gene_type:complete
MDIHEAIAEVQQPRSRYMLEHLTLGAHDTAEMRFYYCVIELDAKLHAYKLATINKRRQEREMARLKESDEPDADLDLEEAELNYQHFLGVMAGGERELRDLLDIYEAMEHFTRAQIDANQQAYWKARMTRQTQLQIMAGGVEWSQLDAMRKVGMLDDLAAEHESMLAQTNSHGEISP